MKTKNFFRVTVLTLTAILMFAMPSQATKTQEVLGDHFSLEGALDLFKKATTPEDFESQLNNSDHLVSNLDLDADGYVDYIRVEDFVQDDVHAMVLSVMLSAKEQQDIAVIEIEKTGASSAMLQIIGDEDMFGSRIIIEPYEEGADLRSGPDAWEEVARLTVNVWVWPSVRALYRPTYVAWRSPWKWQVYPHWWKPSKPHTLVWYRVHRPHYHPHFHTVHTHKVVRAHKIYVPKRRTAQIVQTRRIARLNPPQGRSVTTTRHKVVRSSQRHGTALQKTTTMTAKGHGHRKTVVRHQSTTGATSSSTGGPQVRTTKASVHSSELKGYDAAKHKVPHSAYPHAVRRAGRK